MNELAKLQENGIGLGESQAVTPMDLLQIAVNKDADVAKLAQLLDLQLKWEANEAKKAYYRALSAFKAEVPEILKNKKALFDSKRTGGQVSYEYATLDNVCDKLIPALSKHGLSHKWLTEYMANGKIRVTCVISHQDGYSEAGASLEASPDESGAKNPVQAIGSTTQYLMRYTFTATCGVAVKGQDTDALPQMEGLQTHLGAIVSAESLPALEKAFKAGFAAAMLEKDMRAALALANAKDERKKTLLAEEPA